MEDKMITKKEKKMADKLQFFDKHGYFPGEKISKKQKIKFLKESLDWFLKSIEMSEKNVKKPKVKKGRGWQKRKKEFHQEMLILKSILEEYKND